MNLLVVDDEMPAVRRIVKVLKCDELGINHVFTAYNVRDAIECFEKNHIDILLTDIKMVNGSGLDLLKWLQEQNLNCAKLILTSYPDFNYAKTAISLGVMEYILKPVTKDDLNSIIKKAADAIRKNRNDNIESTSSSKNMPHYDSVISKAKRFIAENISGSLSRQSIAENLNINADYLAKLFKKETGLSMSDYIKNERILEAQRLLDFTVMPIGLIAESVGYETFSYFSAVFKNETGMSPLEYRNRNREQ